jgi:hypothetical protein
MSTVGKAPSESSETPKTRKWQFPSAFTVFAGVTVVVWALAFVVPDRALRRRSGTTTDPCKRRAARRFVTLAPLTGGVYVRNRGHSPEPPASGAATHRRLGPNTQH